MAVREYVEHYHRERHRQGIDGSIITPEVPPPGDGSIRRHERLGGLLNYAYREAA